MLAFNPPLPNDQEPQHTLEAFMRKRIQIFWFTTVLSLLLGIATSGSQLNAQQNSSSPATAGGQAQEPGQPPAQQPGQQAEQPSQPAPAPQAGQQQGVQTFEGQIVKSGDKYVFQDSATGATYDIDHQEEVSKHLGRKVRVTGTLDPSGKMIHLQPGER
jgi:hypothetical protein